MTEPIRKTLQGRSISTYQALSRERQTERSEGRCRRLQRPVGQPARNLGLAPVELRRPGQLSTAAASAATPGRRLPYPGCSKDSTALRRVERGVIDHDARSVASPDAGLPHQVVE